MSQHTRESAMPSRATSALRRVLLSLLVALAIVGALPTVGAAPAGADEPDPGSCTATWDGGAGTGRWDDAANWADDQLPDAADVACIDTGAGTVTHSDGDVQVRALQAFSWVQLTGGRLRIDEPSSFEGVAVDGGTLDAEGSVHAEQLQLRGGTVTGRGDVEAGQLSWTAGTMSGPGRTTVTDELDVDQGPAARTLAGRWLVAKDAVLGNQGSLALEAADGGSADDGTVGLRVDDHLLVDEGDALVSGDGSLEAAEITLAEGSTLQVATDLVVQRDADVTIDGPGSRLVTTGWLDLQGVVDVTGGTLVVAGPATAADTSEIDTDTAGTLTVDDDGDLHLQGTTDVGHLVNDGTLHVESHTTADDVRNGGTLTVDGTALTVAKGTYDQIGPMAATRLAGDDALIDADDRRIQIQGGELSGSGTLTGAVVNGGSFALADDLGVHGSYAQTADGVVGIGVDGDRTGSLTVLGPATLDGTAGLHPTGPVPTEPFVVLDATRVTGSWSAAGGAADCGTFEYTDHQVSVNPLACVVVGTASGAEDGPPLEFPVHLSAPATDPVVVTYEARSWTATAGEDFAPAAGSVTIPVGGTDATISVPLIDDEDVEGAEELDLHLSSVGAHLGSDTAVGTIVDDDEEAVEPPELQLHPIPMSVDVGQVRAMNRSYIVGDHGVTVGEEHQAWAYDLETGVAAYLRGVVELEDLNDADHGVGDCGAVDGCFRSAAENHTVKGLDAQRHSEPQGLNDRDVIVGSVVEVHDTSIETRAAIWPTPDADPQLIDGLDGGDRSEALDLNEQGTMIGTITLSGLRHGWVGTTRGIREIPIPQGFASLVPAAINEAGVVVGTIWKANRTDSHAFRWTAKGGLVDLGPGGAEDINTAGTIVGWRDEGFGVMWLAGHRLELTDLAKAPGWTVYVGRSIDDDGNIAAEGTHGDGFVPMALTTRGLGCKVCPDLRVDTAQYPNPDAWVESGNATTDGNRVRLRDHAANNDKVPHEVTVTFQVDGHQVGEPVTKTIASGETADLTQVWDSSGGAFSSAGGHHEVTSTLTYPGAERPATTTADLLVDPRPVVLVHGEDAGPALWNRFGGWLAQERSGWRTTAPALELGPDHPDTVAHSATKLASAIEELQRSQRAWQVDLVADGVGGIVSRLYVDSAMPNRGGVRTVGHLVMLGTPNAGTPCADLLVRTPSYFPMRTDVMADFNARHHDTHGVAVTSAAADHLPYTCTSLDAGDGVVSQVSAASGVDDALLLGDVAHNQLAASRSVFDAVVPRLRGAAPASVAGLTAGRAAARTTTLAAGSASPQLLVSTSAEVAGGESSVQSFTVPTGTSAITAVAVGDESLEVRLERDGDVQATSGHGDGTASGPRIARVEAPTASTHWKVRVTRHDDGGPREVEVEVAADGLATRLEATATQVEEDGDVRVTAHLAGPPPPAVPGHLLATLVPADGGEELTLPMRDDGTGGDDVAGDGEYAGVARDLRPVGYGILVSTDGGTFLRMTTTAVAVEHGEDVPGRDDVPVALADSISVPSQQTATLRLRGLDPEGAELGFELVGLPTHGTLGGTLPALSYRPTRGYLGPDSFTFRVNDGGQWSDPATIAIDVTRPITVLDLIEPSPLEATTGRLEHLSVRLRDADLQKLVHAPITFRLGDQVLHAETGIDGFAGVDVRLHAPGTYDLRADYAGDATHAPSTTGGRFRVLEGAGPVPRVEGPVTGEAGYPVRVLVNGGDPDADTTRIEVDLDGDGTFEQSVDVEPASNHVEGFHRFDHTYPAAYDGPIRARVTDAAGHVAEVSTTAHIAPHRALGALQRLVDADGSRLEAGSPGRLTADGQQVLFDQTRDAIDGATGPLAVLDRRTGTSEVVSVLPDGTVDELEPAGVISSDGRYVAFGSYTAVGGKLVDEVYLRDRQARTTTLVSVGRNGLTASWHAAPVAVTDDGRVLFHSSATNLGWTIPSCGTVGQTYEPCWELFLRDPVAGTTTLVSHDDTGAPTPVDSLADEVDLTADGRFAVWAYHEKVWLWDATTGATTRLGIGEGGADSNGPDVAAGSFQLSEDGRYVAFTSTGTNLDDADHDIDTDVFRFDRATGTTVLVSRPSGHGSTGGGASAASARMSGDGNLVVFSARDAALVPGDGNDAWDVYVRDVRAETTTRVSEEARDHVEGDDASIEPLVSCDGRWVVFSSDASNLVPGDVNARRDVFAFDRGTATPCRSDDGGGDGEGGDDGPPTDQPPTLSLTAPATMDEAGTATITATAADPEGEPPTYRWSTSMGVLVVAADGRSATLSVADGPNTATVTVVASAGSGSTTASAQVAVRNLAPTVDAGPAVTAPVGTPAHLVATVGDPSTADVAAGLTTTWTFGDGTTGTGRDVTHTYDHSGTFTATATVRDRDGATATDSVTVTVTATGSTGTVTGLLLDAGGLGLFQVKGGPTAYTGGLGWIGRYGIVGTATFTGLRITPDKGRAWIEGITSRGQHLVVYVEDNGNLLQLKDVFRLWIDGREATAGTTRVLGDITIR